MEGNHFTGTIPSEFGNCIELEYLGLSDNKLHGTVPSALGAINLGNTYKAILMGINSTFRKSHIQHVSSVMMLPLF
jgi:hypothetical protein